MVSPAFRSGLRLRAVREAFAEISLAALPVGPQPAAAAVAEPRVPGNLLCPISLQIMRDPVKSPATGITYDRESAELWMGSGFAACPVTGRALLAKDLEPNHATLRMIKEWRAARSGSGAEPERTPEALLLAVMSAAARRGNGAACGRLAAKAMALGKKKESRRCVVAAGAGRALSSAFCQLAGQQPAPASGALDKVLAALAVFLPLDDDDEARRHLATPAALDAVVATLSRGEPGARASAAVVLGEIAAAASSPDALDAVCAANGMYEALFDVLERPVSPRATKAALVAAYRIATHAGGAEARRLVDRGMVRVLVDMLVGAAKGTAEKALAVLDSLLAIKEGRCEARAHALAVPVLVEKARNASGVAMEFAASALRRLGNGVSGECPCETEALQVGRMCSVTKVRARATRKGSKGAVEGIGMVNSKGTKTKRL